MNRKQQKLEIAKGQQIISAAEFSFGFKEISREEFDNQINIGNRYILNALDGRPGCSLVADLYRNLARPNNGFVSLAEAIR